MPWPGMRLFLEDSFMSLTAWANVCLEAFSATRVMSQPNPKNKRSVTMTPTARPPQNIRAPSDMCSPPYSPQLKAGLSLLDVSSRRLHVSLCVLAHESDHGIHRVLSNARRDAHRLRHGEADFAPSDGILANRFRNRLVHFHGRVLTGDGAEDLHQLLADRLGRLGPRAAVAGHLELGLGQVDRIRKLFEIRDILLVEPSQERLVHGTHPDLVLLQVVSRHASVLEDRSLAGLQIHQKKMLGRPAAHAAQQLGAGIDPGIVGPLAVETADHHLPPVARAICHYDDLRLHG